jgi:Recombinase zinc beta ribbon domain/Recombinase
VIIPQIFAQCIAGQSLRQIAAWLDSKHVPTRSGNAHWNEGSVRWIIRCSAYAGRWIGTDCEAVIAPSIYDRANFALRNHPKRGPAKNPPLLAKLRCARCGSPMYRLASGKKRKLYYRCFGSGPQRKGCGNMVPLAQTDIIVTTRVFMTSTDPHQDRIWVDGSNWDEEISRTKQLMREAVDTENFAELEELQAKLADYRSRESVPGHYDLIDTGITVGDYFDSLAPEGKREYLKSRDIRVEKIANPELGASYGVRVVLDGIDHGVYPYPPEIDAGS